ncbi:MAG: PAS domain S-box protein, partial [Spirochaetia bacterium]|nr:PAS domain S-box protein [Spirochaetia bacterium]
MFSSKNIPSDQTDNKDKLTHVEVLKNNYKELLQSEQNLFTIFKNIPAIVFAVDRNYRILYINHVPEGLNIDETIGTDAISYVAEEHRSLVREKIDSVFNTGNHADYEISARGPENTMSWYETHLVPNVENGSVQSVILITDDITKHIKIENSLKISEERWRSLVSDAPDIILTLDRAYKILYINHTAPGITPEESIGRNVFDFVPPDYQTTVKNTIDGVFQTGKQGHYHTKVEVIKNAPLWYSTRVSAVLKDNTIDSVMLITRDITEQKKLTEEKHHLQLQLERSQRMESIGRITGGIAHDFNNILSIILLNAELASDHGNVKSNSYLLENINEIKNSCIRARDLISQMLAFSKPMKYKEIQSSVNLELFFEEIKKVLRSVLPSTIQIDLNLPADLPEIDINPVKLQQIIINLSINAADAMKNSGILKIHAEKQTVTNQICNSCQQCFSGDYTVIKISDTGHGIKPELVDKIFEPFFTTKEVGKGSGMGLSMVHGALHECGGHIHLETDEIGTEFNL